MPDPASIPPVERAIALAAWASIYMLKPVPIEEDEIAAVLGWKDHLDAHDRFFEQVLPSYLSLWDLHHPDTVALAQAILPDGGNARPLQRYFFFEATIDPRKTDLGALLQAIGSALKSRLLPDSSHQPAAVGGFVIGELGVIQGCASSWTGTRAKGSFAEYVAALLLDYTRTDLFVEAAGDALIPQGWSGPWAVWSDERYRRMRNQGRLSSDCCQRDWHGPEWRPITRSATRVAMGGCLPQWCWSTIAGLQRFDADRLNAILRRCVEYDRRVFHDGIDWTHAPEARRLLDMLPSELAAHHARQLLLVAPPETVVAAAMELGYRPPVSTGHGTSFAEQLTDLLLIAAERADARQLLQALASRAGGSDRDQVLHYVIRQGPDAVLRGFLMWPSVATEIARITGAPLRFHRTESWDPSEPADNAALITHVETMLGKQRPPPISDRARPLTAHWPNDDCEALRNRLNQGRRRAEWIFKTAIQYLYRLLHTSYGPVDLRIDGRDAEPRFWQSTPFMERLASHNASLKCLLPTHPKRPLSLRDLLAISAASDSLVPDNAQPFLNALRRGQQELRRLCEEMKVPPLGTDGSHDNPMDRRSLLQAVSCVKAFDDAALAVPDALPRFFLFTRLVMKPNTPGVGQYEPHPDLPSPSSERVEHFASDWDLFLGPPRGDRIYAVTDVTRNTISINPIIHDWTDWLTE